MSDIRVYETRFGPESVGVLREAIDEARAGDKLSPVTVAVQPYAGLHLRRRLATPDIGGSAGLVNVGFMSLARIAELAGAPLLAGRGLRPASKMLSAEIVRDVLDSRHTLFDSVRNHPSTVNTLLRAFEELRPVEPAKLEQLRDSGGGATKREVIELYGYYRRRFEELKLYDRVDLLRAATQAVNDGGLALRDLGHVILHLPVQLTALEAAFLKALANRNRLSVVFGLTGNAEADALVLPMAEALGVKIEQAQPQEFRPSTIVCADDAEGEIRQVIRQVLSAAEEGVPLYRMAVLFRQRNEYARLVYEQFEVAGVQCNGRSVDTLGDTPFGRLVRGLVRVQSNGLRREEVMDWLTSSPVQFGGEPAPAVEWDRVSRLAGVTRGITRWRDRLGASIRSCKAEIASDDEEHSNPDTAKRDMGLAEQLLEFVELIETELAWDTVGSWPDFRDRALEKLQKFGPVCSDSEKPEPLLQIENAICDLTMLGIARTKVSFADFATAVDGVLSQTSSRHGHYGRGVFIGTFSDAQALEFDRVFILGMCEGLVPSPEPHDAVLSALDREKAGIGPLGAPNHTQIELQMYLAAASCASKCQLYFPRANWSKGRENLPSRWLLQAATGLADRPAARPVLSDEIGITIDAKWHLVLPSFQSGLMREHPGSLQEYNLKSGLRALDAGQPITSHFLAEDKRLADRFAAEEKRYARTLTCWDGILSPKSCALDSITISPSRLECFARCPRGYFYRYLLRVNEYLEPPQDNQPIRPTDRGLVCHGVLHEFFRHHIDQDPETPWTEADAEELSGLLLERFSYLAPNEPGIARLLFDNEVGALRQSLAEYLKHDSEYRCSNSMRPWALEARLGTDALPAFTLEMDSGRNISFAGRLDRIDRSTDGRLNVIDYKTSAAPSQYQDNPLDGGRRIQLAIYVRALQSLGDSPDVSASYLHLKPPLKSLQLPVSGDLWSQFDAVVGVLVDTICSGLFPATPVNEQGCMYCSNKDACPADRGRIWRAKQQDPLLAEFLNLSGGSEDEEANDVPIAD